MPMTYVRGSGALDVSGVGATDVDVAGAGGVSFDLQATPASATHERKSSPETSRRLAMPGILRGGRLGSKGLAGRSGAPRPSACDVAIRVYTFRMKPVRAKLFQNGGSQAVRLPRDCRFPRGQTEVVVKKVGRRVILEPVEEWPDEFLAALGSLSEEIPRPKQIPITKLRDPFR
jgi:antitoxin VapB